MSEREYFQNAMPADVCYGCGTANEKGLQIKSYWQDDLAICEWQPATEHQGWVNLTCGGIIATLIDCHCVATAMATAIRNENRPLMSEPRYVFATGSLNVKFLKPSINTKPLRLEAQVTGTKLGKKYTVSCDVFSAGEKTVESEVIALLVYRSDRPDESSSIFKC